MSRQLLAQVGDDTKDDAAYRADVSVAPRCRDGDDSVHVRCSSAISPSYASMLKVSALAR
jgi:hypothetical protein